MEPERATLALAVEEYLRSRPRWLRWREWLGGRQYRFAHFGDRAAPLVILAHARRDAARAHEMARAIEQNWTAVPDRCRETYAGILDLAPGMVIVQLRRRNVCTCLGHRHMGVNEEPFAQPHEAFGGASVGELDLAYERVAAWQALPLSDLAFDTRFLEGSRQKEFHAEQLRLKLLSVLLHEINHLVFPQDPEASIRERSLGFYREALASYVEDVMASLSFTIDRSFSRLG